MYLRHAGGTHTPPLLLLGREVGQNTCVGPAQTFTANDGAEGSESCFIFLVFLASLRSKRERQGCFQHSEPGGGGGGTPESLSRIS